MPRRPAADASPTTSRAGRTSTTTGVGAACADRGEQGSVGGLQPGTWSVATQDEDLQVLGGVPPGEQGEQLDGAAQRAVGEVRQHQVSSAGGAEAPPYQSLRPGTPAHGSRPSLRTPQAGNPAGGRRVRRTGLDHLIPDGGRRSDMRWVAVMQQRPPCSCRRRCVGREASRGWMPRPRVVPTPGGSAAAVRVGASRRGPGRGGPGAAAGRRWRPGCGRPAPVWPGCWRRGP
jgi:hypothetical protein